MEPTWSDVLSSKNRKAVSVFNCLSVKAEAHYVDFEMTSALRNREVATMAGIVKVCLPTFSLTEPVSTLLSAGEDRDQHHPPVSASLLSPPGSGQSHRQLVHPRHRGRGVPGLIRRKMSMIPWDLVDIEVVSVETHLAGRVILKQTV